MKDTGVTYSIRSCVPYLNCSKCIYRSSPAGGDINSQNLSVPKKTTAFMSPGWRLFKMILHLIAWWMCRSYLLFYADQPRTILHTQMANI